jgi:hypothetical protein
LNPLLNNPFALSGMRIIEDATMVDAIEDWSDVRSPSRARRRMRYGHRQNIKIAYVPKKEIYQIGGGFHPVPGGPAFVMHPVMAEELRRKIVNGESA